MESGAIDSKGDKAPGAIIERIIYVCPLDGLTEEEVSALETMFLAAMYTSYGITWNLRLTREDVGVE